MPKLRNPGLYSFLILALACLMVVALYFAGSPDAMKLGGALVGLVITAFTAKSAIEQRGRKVKETHITIGASPVTSVAREKPQTWPGTRAPATVDSEEIVSAPDLKATLKAPPFKKGPS